MRWIDCPWVLDFLATGDRNRGGAAGGHAGGGGDGEEEADNAVDALAVMDALYARREEWQLRAAFETSDFVWQLLGGAWTSAHAGVSYDAFEAHARSGEPVDFCIAFGLARSASFFISVYTEEGAFVLACAWCHRMQWLLNKADEEGHADVNFDAAVLATYVEPINVQAVYESVGTIRVRQRIDNMRAIVPVRRRE
jgi:hypothetical protein